MASSQPPRIEIHVDEMRGICNIFTGPARAHTVGTIAAVGAALVNTARVRESDGGAEVADASATAARGRWDWTDMLATHGVAVGDAYPSRIIISILPPSPRTISYRSTSYPSIPFPGLIAAIKFNKTTRMLAASTLHVIDPAAAAAHLTIGGTRGVAQTFPYGNVYVGSGSVCWGDVAHDTITSIADFIQTFFASGFNSDLCAMHGICGEPGSSTLAHVAAAIVDKTRTALPIPTAYPITMAHVVSGLGA